LFGGFTAKNWTGAEIYQDDQHAFVFNLQNKYTPTDPNKAIFTQFNGFRFGDGVLSLTARDEESLNSPNKG
jgi:hypothetical protein